VFLSYLISEYRKSLKPPEIEEHVNQLINRPLGFFVAKFFQTLNLSPNFVTALSLLCGISSGVFFSRATYPDIFLAALLLQSMIIFDCADGQLARLTDRGSKFGRIIDTFADLTTHGSIFAGVAIGLHGISGSPLPFILAFFSLISMHLHMALFDHFKSVYINVAKPDYADRLVCLKNMKDKLARMDTDKSRLLKIITKMYVGFYKMESKIVNIGYPLYSTNFYELFQDPASIDSRTGELYSRDMRVPTKLWTMIGDTIHLEIFVLCAILNKLSFIFPLILVYTNVVMIIALIIQRTKYRNLGLEYEVFWQERFD
jgi:phosphatidylglycerophosphate synthase